jgi:hypothetical protein
MDNEVASIVAFYCEILLGKAHPSLGLACREHLDRKRLDYSLESLKIIDEYLLHVHRNFGARPISELANTIMAVAFYVGEVIRLATPQTQCQWARSIDTPPVTVAAGVAVADMGELVLTGCGAGPGVIPADAVAQIMRNGAAADSIQKFALTAMKVAWTVPPA